MTDFGLIWVLGVLLCVVVCLLVDRWKPSYVFGSGVLVLMLSGNLDVSLFLSGFSKTSVISLFLLIILTSAINKHFNVSALFDYLFRKAKSPRSFLLRMGFSVAGLSSIMNNTPIVAMMIPYVYQWGKRHAVSPSQLLIPLSFATILGGMISVIGTSTNMVLLGLIESESQILPGILDFAIPGLLVTLAGLLYISLFAQKLLPENKDVLDNAKANLKEYLIETKLQAESSLCGLSVADAGLRNLDGIFLVEILRDGSILAPVSSEEILQGEDRLIFAGEPDKVLELVHVKKGLVLPAQAQLSGNSLAMNLVETVIPANSQFIGSSLKELAFREKYDGAVIAVHRNGEKLRGKIGEITLDKGDVLLVSSGKSFEQKINVGKDLYLISSIKKVIELPTAQKRLFWLLSLLIFALCAAGFYPFILALVLELVLCFLFKMSSFEQAKQNISLDLLIILGSSIGLSNALIESGAALWISDWIRPMAAEMGSDAVVVMLYVLTLVLTQFITNVASLSVVFPIAFALCESMGIAQMPVYMAIAFGASCSFMSPVGYQTNLMVYGAGNYKFSDFIRFGLPLTLIYSLIALGWIVYHYR